MKEPETKPNQMNNPQHQLFEIVYDRERDQKKYFEAESQSVGVLLDKGMFWRKNSFMQIFD